MVWPVAEESFAPFGMFGRVVTRVSGMVTVFPVVSVMVAVGVELILRPLVVWSLTR